MADSTESGAAPASEQSKRDSRQEVTDKNNAMLEKRSARWRKPWGPAPSDLPATQGNGWQVRKPYDGETRKEAQDELDGRSCRYSIEAIPHLLDRTEPSSLLALCLGWLGFMLSQLRPILVKENVAQRYRPV